MNIKTLVSLSGTDKNERWLVLANFVREVGMQAAYWIGILGYAAFGFGGSAQTVMLIMLTFNLAAVIGGVIGGYLVDKLGPKLTVLWSTVTTTLIGFMPIFIDGHVPSFIVFTALFAISATVLNTAYVSFAPYLEREKEGLRRVNALLTIGVFAAAIAGPALGAIATGTFPVYSVFILMSVATAIGGAISLRVSEKHIPESEEEEQSNNPFREAAQGWKYIRKSRNLRYYLAAAVAMIFGFGAFDALEPLYFKQILQVDISAIGWINALGGTGAVVGVLLLAVFPLRWINSRLLIAFLVICGAGCVIYIGTLSLVWVGVGQLILGFAFGVFDPLMRTLVQADAPLKAVGRVLGTINSISLFLLLIPLVIAPWLSDLFGVQEVLIVMGALPIVFGALLYPSARRLDREAGERQIESVSALD